MSKPFKIRDIRKSDAEDFCNAEYSYYKELQVDHTFGTGTYGKKIDRKSIARSFDTLYKSVKRGRSVAVVAEVNGHLIGVCEINPSRLPEAPHMGEMGISVLKNYRRAGIGTALMKEAIRRAHGKYEILEGNVLGQNTGSIKLLKKFRFRLLGVGRGFAKRGKVYLDNHFMYLKL